MSSGLAPGTSAATKLARFFDKVIILFILQHFSIFSVLFLHNKLLLTVLCSGFARKRHTPFLGIIEVIRNMCQITRHMEENKGIFFIYYSWKTVLSYKYYFLGYRETVLHDKRKKKQHSTCN